MVTVSPRWLPNKPRDKLVWVLPSLIWRPPRPWTAPVFVLQIAPYIFTSTAPPHIFTKYFQIIKLLVVVAVIGCGGVVVVLLLVLEMSFSGFVKAKCWSFFRINEIWQPHLLWQQHQTKRYGNIEVEVFLSFSLQTLASYWRAGDGGVPALVKNQSFPWWLH